MVICVVKGGDAIWQSAEPTAKGIFVNVPIPDSADAFAPESHGQQQLAGGAASGAAEAAQETVAAAASRDAPVRQGL